MILIVESGSTKADWVLLDGVKTISSFQTKGWNPLFLSSEQMMAKYRTMTVGDTVHVKTAGKIIDVCTKKGCWMKLDMGNNNAVRVTFKDYGFFVPTDASGEVIVNGMVQEPTT